ncbi:MAG: redoxin domain-containing protein [Deltaproteobacteria bacterium]|nr:redoxin domain-containing protein [Deltaproteobacteria bacterium]
MSIEIGQDAPDFALKGILDTKAVELSHFRGKSNVVLFFFPLAFSSVCTDEFCSLRDDVSQYDGFDAKVLGISVDSPFALAAWAKEFDYPFDLLSDFNRQVSPQYDSLYEELMGFKGVSKRSAFVIDKAGKIRYAEVCPSPGDLPSFDKIRATLATLS